MDRYTERITERSTGKILATRIIGERYKAYDRLAEYEETGLTPDQIKAIDVLYAMKCKEVASLEKAMQERWIPCNKRLPEDKTMVLATVFHRRWISDYDFGNKEWCEEHPEHYEVCTVYRDGDEYVKIDDSDYVNISYIPISEQEENLAYPIEEVFAWMPLPEAYKEKDGVE